MSVMKVSDKPFASGGYGGRIDVAELGSRIRKEIKALLGESITVDKHQNADLDAWKSHDMLKAGLAFQLSGRATIVQARVASHLTTFDDPLKLMMPPMVCESDEIVVRKKMVVGSGAEIVPESAPARAVRTREEEVSVHLQRYGADIIMDTNLLMMPGAYADEFNLKLDFQQRAMEAKLVELGYRQIMAECAELHEAIVDANPAFARLGDAERKEHGLAAWNQCFGALQKYTNGVGVIMAMAKRASSAPFDTLIVPAGTEEISNFGVASNATYLVSGIRDSDKAITFGSDLFRVDPISGLRVGVSRPPQTFDAGSSYPRARVGHLSRTVRIAVKETDKSWNHLTNAKATGDKIVIYDIVVSSAIIGVAGSGHLCLGYPSTSTFSVPTSPEESTTQLRTYLGACVTQKESMMIIPNCFVEGISARYVADGDVATHTKEVGGINYVKGTFTQQGGTGTLDIAEPSAATKLSVRIYDAATFGADGKMTSPNMGPLGNLDRVHGGLGSITAGIVVRKMD